jgi:transaldolase
MASLKEVRDVGQSVWYDNISRDLILSGAITNLVNLGVTGLTSNPSIFDKAISESSEYDESLKILLQNSTDDKAIYESLAIEDIRSAADLLYGVYLSSKYKDGYACLEVSPLLAYDTEGTIFEAQRLFKELARPNVMIKVPATPEGIPAIKSLISKGINVNVTLIFSLAAHRDVMEAYISGLEDLDRSGGDVSTVASVASFFVSRLDTSVDAVLEGLSKECKMSTDIMLGKSAIANAKIAYESFCLKFGTKRFEQLRTKGALVQRPLWASTSTKNPLYRDVLYVEQLMGADTVNTVPPSTLDAFIDHGIAEDTILSDLDDAKDIMELLRESGVNVDDITTKLLKDGVDAFSKSFVQILSNVQAKRSILVP